MVQLTEDKILIKALRQNKGYTDLSLCVSKCCSVVFGITLKLLVINISSSTPDINKLHRLLPAISVTTCRTVVRWWHVDNNWPACSEARYGLRIVISAYHTCIRRLGVPIGIVPCRLVWKN